MRRTTLLLTTILGCAAAWARSTQAQDAGLEPPPTRSFASLSLDLELPVTELGAIGQLGKRVITVSRSGAVAGTFAIITSHSEEELWSDPYAKEIGLRVTDPVLASRPIAGDASAELDEVDRLFVAARHELGGGAASFHLVNGTLEYEGKKGAVKVALAKAPEPVRALVAKLQAIGEKTDPGSSYRSISLEVQRPGEKPLELARFADSAPIVLLPTTASVVPDATQPGGLLHARYDSGSGPPRLVEGHVDRRLVSRLDVLLANAGLPTLQRRLETEDPNGPRPDALGVLVIEPEEQAAAVKRSGPSWDGATFTLEVELRDPDASGARRYELHGRITNGLSFSENVWPILDELIRAGKTVSDAPAAIGAEGTAGARVGMTSVVGGVTGAGK